MSSGVTRRRLLGSIAAVTATGALAGCSGGGGNGDGGNDNTPVMVEAPSDLSEYLSEANDANNFDGQMADATDVSNPTVMVGAGDGLAFDPVVIQVASGTTITWEWTGEGGTHNVVADNGSFDSGSAVAEEGTTFEHTFDDSGTFGYRCVPHQNMGMLGAVVVE